MNSPVAELREKFVAAQLSGNRREAMRVVIEEGLARGVPVPDLQSSVIQAAQRRIGELWQANEISIAQEHMATAISHVVLTRLFEEAKLEPRCGLRVVVACVEGENHEFPARLVADFLDIGGFDVRYLGANVPTDDLLKMLEDEPDLLALSVTMSFHAAKLVETVERVRAAHPRLPILAGGHALGWEPDLARLAGVQTCGPEAKCVVEKAHEMIARSRA